MSRRSTSGASPMRMAEIAAGRQASSRHARRAAEAEARKAAEGLSVPKIKKLIRRNKQKRGKK